jgi:hypothetical protein
MDFKFFKGDETPTLLFLQPYPTFIQDNVEFCFQFGDEEPVVFATGPNDCNIRLSPTSNAEMTFNDNGKVFKLFARERQND